MKAKEIYEAETGDMCPSDQIAYHEWHIRFVNWLENRVESLYQPDTMFQLYQKISEDHKVPVERMLLAITDDAKHFQVYSTDENEVQLHYICDVPVPSNKVLPIVRLFSDLMVKHNKQSDEILITLQDNEIVVMEQDHENFIVLGRISLNDL